MSQLTRFDGHGLDARENAILKKLATQWKAHQPQNDLRGLYYLGKRSLSAAGKLGFAMPPSLEKLAIPIGWPAKAVSALEHRLDIRGFLIPEDPDRDDGIDEIVRDNDLLLESSMAHTAGLIHGAAFVTVSAGDQQAGEPPAIIAARSAREATALWSKRSRQVTAGLTINSGNGIDEPPQATLWLPHQVITITKSRAGYQVQRTPHQLGRVPMELLAFRPYLENEHGQPRINDVVMGLTDAAVRTVLRMEGTAEFFSFPQRYALGANKDDFENTFKVYLNRLLALGRDDEGNLPELGEFKSSSPEPHIAQLRALGAQFAGEVGVPLNQLGIVQDNPSSADAIRAAESELIKTAERAQRGYSRPWSRTVAMAHQIYVGGRPDPRLDRLMTQWYSAATETQAATSQSVMALVTAGVLPARGRITWEQLGYDEATIRRLEADSLRERSDRMLETLTGAAGVTPDLAAHADEIAGRPDPQAAAMDPVKIKAKADALGALIRAGVEAESAAEQVGLKGLEFTGATPVSLRQPEDKAAQLEER